MENSFSCLILRATCGTRTRDPRITNALLYQLSQGGDNLVACAKVRKNEIREEVWGIFFEIFLSKSYFPCLGTLN